MRTTTRWIVIVMAGMALAGTAAAADKTKKRRAAPEGFFAKFLAPRMASSLNGEVSAAAFFANPAANPWTQDDRTVQRVETRAIHATKSAIKNYAISSLGIDAWSLPLSGARGTGLDALKTESGGTRLRFGFAHLAPRAEILMPVSTGRVAVNLDAVGRMGASFETPASNLRVGASVDPRAHSGAFALAWVF